jgi:hypothetical protein
MAYSYHTHEVLHMSHFLERAVQDELYDHPAIKDNPERRELAEKAMENLAELYQLLGQEMYEDAP